ncbi:hypothetical protein [Propionivibrio sp.]|uniref:hypothetical protein n=1 Tax=Propionivibrio sp. TaxID=2212460 RepID=UPI003BF0A926
MGAETMPTNHMFHTGTALAEGLRALFKQLEERLSLRSPLNVYLAGGMAVHLYTASRVTTDVDAEFGSRVFIPNDLLVNVTLEDGTRESIYFDTNYNASFALMHEDYLDDAVPLEFRDARGQRQIGTLPSQENEGLFYHRPQRLISLKNSHISVKKIGVEIKINLHFIFTSFFTSRHAYHPFFSFASTAGGLQDFWRVWAGLSGNRTCPTTRRW